MYPVLRNLHNLSLIQIQFEGKEIDARSDLGRRSHTSLTLVRMTGMVELERNLLGQGYIDR